MKHRHLILFAIYLIFIGELVSAKSSIFLDLKKPLKLGDEIFLDGTFRNQIAQTRFMSSSTSCSGGVKKNSNKPSQCHPLVIRLKPRLHKMEVFYKGAENNPRDVMLNKTEHESIAIGHSFRLVIEVGDQEYVIKMNGERVLRVKDNIGHEQIQKIRSYGGNFNEYYVVPYEDVHPTVIDVRSTEMCGMRPGLSVGTARIIGGVDAKPGEFPWQGALRRKFPVSWAPSLHFCGATLLKSCWAITAGHCVGTSSSGRELGFVLRLGDFSNEDGESNPLHEDQQEVDIEEVFVHPDFLTHPTPRNDIALLRLRSTREDGMCAVMSKFVQPVCLPKNEPITVKTVCTISGWGALNWTEKRYPHILQKADIIIRDFETCRSAYGLDSDGNHRLVDKTFCAAGPGMDSCQGDSGGPLVCKRDMKGSGTHFILWGITSWGDGCASAERPGIYTKVIDFLEWIHSIIE